MTEEEKRLEKYRRYNMSSKGRARRERYEAKHPERRERLAPIMLIKARQGRI